jgi:4-amino-4-deoxy-L-arabinose transferase-like glycosyltransferase
MVSISLFIELLRTRPLWLFWAFAAMQLVLWTAVPMLFFSAPPGQLPMVLAVGREFQFGTDFGPPLAFWLAEAAYRSAGLFGVYLLSQVCIVVTFWAVLQLGRAMVGDSHAVIAVLLMAGVAVFSVPSAAFGPGVLAAPLWALILMHYWLAARDGRWAFWLAIGLEAGLLLMTSYAALPLLGLFVAYLLLERSQFATIGPWIGGLVLMAVLFPTLIWLDLNGGVTLPDWPAIAANVRTWAGLLALLLAGHAGMALLVVLGRDRAVVKGGALPEVARAPVGPEARRFVTYFALAPALAMILFALYNRRPDNFIGEPLVVLSGLLVVVLAGDRIRIGHQYLVGYVWAGLAALPSLLVALSLVVQPWLMPYDLPVTRPAEAMGQFFGDTYQRRTSLPLAMVAGDPAVAPLVAFAAPSRPSLLHGFLSQNLPQTTQKNVLDKGGVVIWLASDATGRPPHEIQQQFPDLAPEVPRTFPRRFQGRMPLTRIGWAVIRP